MKSSNDSVELDLKNLFSNYVRMLHKPTQVINELANKDVNILETLIVTIISALILTAGVFLAGDILYTTFQTNAFTYPLEMLTSGQLFGVSISIYDYSSVFLLDLVFILKAWIFTSMLIFGFLRVFKQKTVSFKRTLQTVSWSLFPYAIIMFLVSVICLGLKFVIPLIYHYMYFGVMIGIFIVVTPILVMRFLEQYEVSFFHSMRAYYLSLFVVFLIFAINHGDRFLYSIW